MDEQDKRLLNAIQADFPLAPQPFRVLGTLLNLTEDEVISRLTEQKRQRVIRQIGGIFDSRSLGYQSSLVAMRVAPDEIDRAAQIINGHPGVSHNYQRNHRFNLWFTIAVPPAGDLEWTVAQLQRTTGAASARMLPTLRVFKIGVQLDMEGNSGAERTTPSTSGHSRSPVGRDALRAEEVAVIRELQEDLPLTAAPYAPMAERIGIPESELLAIASRLKAQGYMRRMAAVLYHREAGFHANAMGVWAVPPDRTEDVGTTMASFRGVSHCYRRPSYPDWPYSIFTMVHGRSGAECEALIDTIARAVSIDDYDLLYSTKEYKKVRLRYFTPEVDQWEARARAQTAPPPREGLRPHEARL